ncbi:MAG: alpha/beta hydrolase [Chloroflexota bacterium]|nr:alpha/beta hydrolase [Chloroflexota bacterium]
MFRRRSVQLSIVVLLVVGVPLLAPTSMHGQRGCVKFPETGYDICYQFLDYWQQHGGLAQQGYPISGRFEERSPVDGKAYMVQYFERAVFEAHPENEPPHDLLLSLLGNAAYKQKYPAGAPNQEPNSSLGSVLFKETGKRLGGRFLQYWQENGGLTQQGFPVSDEFLEKSELDGKTYRVQYFERAVFELHPENQPPHDVLLSQLGTARLKARMGNMVSVPTGDGATLSASIYGAGKTAVILSPQCQQTGRYGWTDFALTLASRGYMAIAYDYRGVNLSRRLSGARPDVSLGLVDLHAIAEFARERGATGLVLAGASCGGTYSVASVATEKPLALIVMASPASFTGFEIPASQLPTVAVPKLFISTEDDRLTPDMTEMYDAMPNPKEKHIYPGSEHGTDIFLTEHADDLSQRLFAFIERHAPAR